MTVSGPVQQNPYSAALGAIQESHGRVLSAVQSLGSGGLEALVDVQLDVMRARTSQAASIRVIQTLQETEGYLLDVLA